MTDHSFTHTLWEEVLKYPKGETFTGPSLREKLAYPNINYARVYNSLAYLCRTGVIKKTSKWDPKVGDYVLYEMVDPDIKPKRAARMESTTTYRAKYGSRHPNASGIRIIPAQANGHVEPTPRSQTPTNALALIAAITQALEQLRCSIPDNAGEGKALNAYTIPELLEEVGRRTKGN